MYEYFLILLRGSLSLVVCLSMSVRLRAVGTLKIAVVRGKGLISSDLSLPGNAYVRVSYVIPDR